MAKSTAKQTEKASVTVAREYINTGVTLTTMTEKFSGALWNLPDGSYNIEVLSKRDNFKSGAPALVTNRGFVGVAAFITSASDEAVRREFIDGETVRIPIGLTMDIEIKNGAIVSAKIAAGATA